MSILENKNSSASNFILPAEREKVFRKFCSEFSDEYPNLVHIGKEQNVLAGLMNIGGSSFSNYNVADHTNNAKMFRAFREYVVEKTDAPISFQDFVSVDSNGSIPLLALKYNDYRLVRGISFMLSSDEIVDKYIKNFGYSDFIEPESRFSAELLLAPVREGARGSVISSLIMQDKAEVAKRFFFDILYWKKDLNGLLQVLKQLQEDKISPSEHAQIMELKVAEAFEKAGTREGWQDKLFIGKKALEHVDYFQSRLDGFNSCVEEIIKSVEYQLSHHSVAELPEGTHAFFASVRQAKQNSEEKLESANPAVG